MGRAGPQTIAPQGLVGRHGTTHQISGPCRAGPRALMGRQLPARPIGHSYQRFSITPNHNLLKGLNYFISKFTIVLPTFIFVFLGK